MLKISEDTYKEVKLDGETIGRIELPTHNAVAVFRMGESHFLVEELEVIVKELNRLNER
jgi:hypothetical protein